LDAQRHWAALQLRRIIGQILPKVKIILKTRPAEKLNECVEHPFGKIQPTSYTSVPLPVTAVARSPFSPKLLTTAPVTQQKKQRRKGPEQG